MQDLSHLANPGWPSYGSSMGGGNTVTDKSTDLMEGAPGSKSEGSADIPSHDSPDLEITSTESKLYKHDQGTESFSSVPTWKKVK
jgi:hypothetical protein